MTVISTKTDPERLTLTLVADFRAAPDAVWSVWEDPRKLERWWGPPQWPATFTRHDFVVNGESRYHMSGPNGEVHRGFWRLQLIERPRRIDFLNGLAGEDGEPSAELPPAFGSVTFAPTKEGTRMTVLTRFVDAAQMETMVTMGMPEGMALAIGQIDRIIAAAPDAQSRD